MAEGKFVVEAVLELSEVGGARFYISLVYILTKIEFGRLRWGFNPQPSIN